MVVCARFSVFAQDQSEIVDGIKGVVANRIVTYAEVEEYTRPAAQALRSEYAGQPKVFQKKLNAALNDSMEQLIERLLILHSFDTGGYKLPSSVVDQLVRERIRQQFGDRITFMKTLQAQGMTVEQFRKQVRDQYIEAAMRNEHVQNQIFVSPYKVEMYYKSHQSDFKVGDQVKLSMIVLPKSGPNDTNTVKLAQEIEAQIKGGASFADMAATYSQGSQKAQGGSWGWVGKDVLRKALADEAFKLKPGTVSQPINTPDTCYLMLVQGRRPAHVRPLNKVAPQIEKTLRVKEQAALQKQWIARLKKKTFVRYF